MPLARITVSLFLLVLLVPGLHVAAANDPSGRPPVGPLERYDERTYDVGFQALIKARNVLDGRVPDRIQLQEMTVAMPFIFNSTFSAVDPDTLRAQLWLDSTPDPDVNDRGRLSGGLPWNLQLAAFEVPAHTGENVRWRMGFRAQVWSSRITSEAEAAARSWPREFPAEVQAGLRPQPYIQSEAPLFRDAVAHVSEGRLRLVPPYYAAKDLVRYCMNSIRVRGDGNVRGNLGVLFGMELQGALRTAETQEGSPHDLVCVCVAMLRAAGIPARPVVGIRYDDERTVYEFVSWLEWYLPEAGWIPVDPNWMKTVGIRDRPVQQAWDGFGNVRELNEWIPLSFSYVAPGHQSASDVPAVWGWNLPRATGLVQHLQFEISRAASASPTTR